MGLHMDWCHLPCEGCGGLVAIHESILKVLLSIEEQKLLCGCGIWTHAHDTCTYGIHMPCRHIKRPTYA